MQAGTFDVLPDERREAVQTAMAAAFGDRPVTALDRLAAGASGALLYRASVAGQPYLLRLDTGRDFYRDPQRNYACMRAAAEAGVAPRVHHADPTTSVVIMDFIAQRPLAEYAGGREAMLRELAGLIARLQATPAFPPLVDYHALIAGMLGMLRASGQLAAGLIDLHVDGCARIREVYPRPAALVSSHNDLNPSNILFDGKRLWLVDWEAAFRNDPLVDVAIVANYFLVPPDREPALLEAWLGQASDRALHARLVVMRQLARLYYACLLFNVLARAEPSAPPETDLAGPDVAEISDRIQRGDLVAAAPSTLRLLGKAFLRKFASEARTPHVEEALRIVQLG